MRSQTNPASELGQESQSLPMRKKRIKQMDDNILADAPKIQGDFQFKPNQDYVKQVCSIALK